MQDQEFEQLYWQLQPRLLGYALAQLDEAAAYDAVAATFETLLRKDVPLANGRARRQAIALAFAILRGHVSHEYRARRRRTSLQSHIADQPQSGRNPDIADDIAAASAVHSWLAALSESDRHVIALYNAGHSTQEIAAVLGCSVAAAARRRDRAKLRLRTIIERDRQEAYGDDPSFA